MKPKDLSDADRRTLRLIKTGGLDQRRGGWRFGTKRVPTEVVERLVANGRAIIHAGRCIPASTAARNDRGSEAQ